MRYQYVDAHVPLRTTDQKWIINVLLDDALLVVLQVLQVADNGDFSASGQIRGLADPHLLSLLAIDSLSGE